MRNEIHPFENPWSYSFASEKVCYLHSSGGERHKKEGNMKRGGKEAVGMVWV